MISNLFNPSTLIIAVSLFSVFVFSVIVTWLVRRYSLKHQVLDVPNERSSHTAPTPRGGGLSISLSILIAIAVLAFIDYLPTKVAIGLGFGGLFVAIIGWLDDRDHIPAIWRATSYLVVGAWFLYWINGVDTIVLGTTIFNPGIVGDLLIIIGIAWLINLYNFMDGTDGLAAVQAICTGMMAAVLFWISDSNGLAIISLVVVFASAGFLVWNWPPARIFMGDVSSCLIGFIFSGLAISGHNSADVSLLVWFILLSIFIMDATLTLIKRMINGEKWYAAHKGHAYQRLIQLGVSHAQLARSVLLINLCLLWPVAYAAYKWQPVSFYLVIFIITLMFILWSFIQLRYHRFKEAAS
jgi:Fuc2NAc and GlcNAc transferase